MKNIRVFLLFVWVFAPLSISWANTNAATTTLNIVANSASSYSIVYPSGNTTIQEFATTLQTAIKNKTGVKLTVKTDAAAATAKEIVLGHTNTRAEHAAIKADMPTYGYRIAIHGSKLVITASDANHMAVALERFESAILKNTSLAGTGFLNFSTSNEQYAKFAQSQATLSSIIANGYSYSISTSLIFHQQKDGNHYVAQGLGTDGKYLYVCLRTSGDVTCRIYKYTMSGTYKSKSGSISGHHANDLTVDTKNGRIVLVHGTGSSKTLSYIDTETLKETGTKTFGRGIGALSYCPERDMYAGSQGGNCVFYTGANLSYSSTYNYERTTSTDSSSGYTAQGMGCDRDYVYFPMSKTGTNNKIVAYDWNGNHKKTFTISNTLESESLCEWNGTYYVGFYVSGNGAKVYKLNITLNYTTSL